ncbi:MAG: HAD-IC family P-type ATPase, partial [Candidatus Limnocylindrales bacterium]
METILRKHWHHLPEEEVLELLESDASSGLDILDVEERQDRFGPNRISERPERGPLLRFLLEFRQPLLLILLVAAVITAVLGEWIDALVIFGVVLVTAFIGFVQESRAKGAIDALARHMSVSATVLRAGQRSQVPAVELVPGDIVLLQSGDRVPADVRLLRARDLQIDESSLTGESVPAAKASTELEQDTVLADRLNMAYSSTLVTYGTATGAVVAIGDNTEIGRISDLLSSTKTLETPLTRRIAQFSRVLLYAILGLAGATFTVGVVRGEDWLDMFMAAVALAVGAIPEGLPAAVTITLAIGVGRMARRHSIIRNLPAVETLGSTTVICSDKTGTLTQNQMTVRRIEAGGETAALSGIGWSPEGELTRADRDVAEAPNVALEECLRAGLLCNDSALRATEDGGWRAQGDPTEVALIVAARKSGLVEHASGPVAERIDAIPFESEHQYMATLHPASAGSGHVAYLKGSPEAILRRCGRRLGADGTASDLDRSSVDRQVDEMAAGGLRVLAFA